MRRDVGVLVATLTLVSMVGRATDSLAAQDARGHEYQSLFAQLEKTDVVLEGPKKAQSILYVFFDANCLYCRLTWKALQPYETVGLQVRWVPVAYQQPSSVGRAAAIMQAPDRVSALRANEFGYNVAQFDGGIGTFGKGFAFGSDPAPSQHTADEQIWPARDTRARLERA